MVNVAVIGCGLWGPNHVRIFNNLPDSRVEAVVDTDPARLCRIAQLFPGISVEQDYQRVLKRQDVDGVVIATPTSTHHRMVRDTLMANKHVLCEKPLCETLVQGQELVELANAGGLILMVGHVFLFNAGVVKVKELLDAGELGTVYYLSAVRTNLGPIRNDVNSAFDLAAHDISIFNWVLQGEPEFASAVGASFLQPTIEDVVFISLRYPQNVVANIQASWLSPKKIRQMTLVGSQKMITWDDVEMNMPVAVYDKGANAIQEYGDYGDFLRISMWEGDVRLPKVQLEEPLRAQNRHFIKAIQDGFLDRSDGKFALGVVKALEAISGSLRIGGAPVRVMR